MSPYARVYNLCSSLQLGAFKMAVIEAFCMRLIQLAKLENQTRAYM